jgi:hypothetical protein
MRKAVIHSAKLEKTATVSQNGLQQFVMVRRRGRFGIAFLQRMRMMWPNAMTAFF